MKAMKATRPRPRRSWFGRWLVRIAERIARRYYEGPEPPLRLRVAVRDFVDLNPKVGTRMWAEFAAEHGDACYRAGYVRGLERRARDLTLQASGQPPMLEDADPMIDRAGWVDLLPSEAEVQSAVDQQREHVERLSPEDRLLYQDLIGQQMGGFRIALLPSAKKEKRR